jgi:hypothetical protein
MADSDLQILILIGLLGLIGVPYLLFLRNKRRKIEALGDETYNKLKNSFDARKIMGEMNYIIDEINKYWNENEYFRKYHEANRKVNNPYSALMIKGMSKIIPQLGENYKENKEGARLFKITKKTLDDYIKKEWNPRIKILRENSLNYFSDKELLDAYNQFVNIDKGIQKLTIEGERNQESMEVLKVAGIVLVASAGLAIGAVGAANKFGDRQSFRDHFGA